MRCIPCVCRFAATTSVNWNIGQTTVEKHKIAFKTAQSIRFTLWCHLSWEKLVGRGGKWCGIQHTVVTMWFVELEYDSNGQSERKTENSRWKRKRRRNQNEETEERTIFKNGFSNVIYWLDVGFNVWLLCTHANSIQMSQLFNSWSDFIVLVNVEIAMVRIFNIIQMPTTH